MKKLNNITVGLACLVLSTGVMAQGVTDDEVVLGTSTALSGPAALWGVSASRAAQIRFDMANESGGVHGRQYVLSWRITNIRFQSTSRR